MLHGRHLPLGCIIQVYMIVFIFQFGFVFPFLSLLNLLFFLLKKGVLKTMLCGRHLPFGCIINVYMVDLIFQE